ncbi:MAG TPA: CBS domain-containing protein [Anaeromyxobacteraceae bacterium]|nr:CBS domain-containing protein [Anaeromyxobacteraceae bacterium]
MSPTTVRDLLDMKNSAVVFACPPETTVAEACLTLRDRRVGCLVVAREGEVQGIFSAGDVVTGVVAEGRDPAAVTVAEVMSRDVPTVTLEASSQDAAALLRQRRQRYLPVVGPRGLLGVVSLGDIALYYAVKERSAASTRS